MPALSAAQRAAIALAVGMAWAFYSLLRLAQPNYLEPVTLLDWVAVISFSVALALLAAAAWLVAKLSDRTRSVVVAAALVALGGLVAAVANFIEDGLGLTAFGEVFAYGVFGVLAGLIGLVVTLALGRRFLLAALCAATFVGLMMSGEAGGGFLILAAWLVVAVSLRRL